MRLNSQEGERREKANEKISMTNILWVIQSWEKRNLQKHINFNVSSFFYVSPTTYKFGDPNRHVMN